MPIYEVVVGFKGTSKFLLQAKDAEEAEKEAKQQFLLDTHTYTLVLDKGRVALDFVGQATLVKR